MLALLSSLLFSVAFSRPPSSASALKISLRYRLAESNTAPFRGFQLRLLSSSLADMSTKSLSVTICPPSHSVKIATIVTESLISPSLYSFSARTCCARGDRAQLITERMSSTTTTTQQVERRVRERKREGRRVSNIHDLIHINANKRRFYIVCMCNH